MNEDLFLIFVGYSAFFGALAVLLLWTLQGQKALRATLNKLQSQIEKGESE